METSVNWNEIVTQRAYYKYSWEQKNSSNSKNYTGTKWFSYAVEYAVYEAILTHFLHFHFHFVLTENWELAAMSGDPARMAVRPVCVATGVSARNLNEFPDLRCNCFLFVSERVFKTNNIQCLGISLTILFWSCVLHEQVNSFP